MKVHKSVKKNVINLLISVFIATGLGFLFGFANQDHKGWQYKSIIIRIKHYNENQFIDEKDVKKVIAGYYGDKYNRHPISVMDLEKLEAILLEDPFVADAEVYSNISGELIFDITEKEPIMRVINMNGVSYYIDKNGMRLPLCDKFTARVPVATGYIFEGSYYHVGLKDQLLKELYVLAKFVYESKYWKAQIEQVHVNGKKDIELITRIGNQYIVLGGVDDLEEKFAKLDAFYEECLKTIGWDKYRIINLKYKDQIVCTKY
ncbi:MAG: hypothetical protein IIA45_03680 [Bacteroidetes bacterium]|nr:hypothetical protein [Bacteroidota bacterium]